MFRDVRSLTAAVDGLAGVDLAEFGDSELREIYLSLRRDLDRQEAFAARLLACVHGRGIAAGDGASSTPAATGARAGRKCTTSPHGPKVRRHSTISRSCARTTTISSTRPGGVAPSTAMSSPSTTATASSAARGRHRARKRLLLEPPRRSAPRSPPRRTRPVTSRPPARARNRPWPPGYRAPPPTAPALRAAAARGSRAGR